MSIRDRAKRLLGTTNEGISGAAPESGILAAAAGSAVSQPSPTAAAHVHMPAPRMRPSIRQALQNTAPYVEPQPSQLPSVLPVTQGATWDRRFRFHDANVIVGNSGPASISQDSQPSHTTASTAPSPPSQPPFGRLLVAGLGTQSSQELHAEHKHSGSATAAAATATAAEDAEAIADLPLPRRRKRRAPEHVNGDEDASANGSKYLVKLDDFLVDSAAPTPVGPTPTAPSPSPSPAPAPAAAYDPTALPPSEDYVVRLDAEGKDVPIGEEHDDDVHLELTVPGSIAGRLRGYQFEGVRFLLGAYACGRGAILADDMGLGKTLQSIAFISAILGKTGNSVEDAINPQLNTRLTEFSALPLYKAGGVAGQTVASDPLYEPDYASCGAPILIVCPASLVDNWRDEFDMWGNFRVAVLHGSTKESELRRVMCGQAEVAITTMETLRAREEKDGEEPEMRQNDFFARVPWHAVIFDEAHKLKNHNSITHRSADRLPTRLRFALSGTPMLNDYCELFHLVNLVAPGHLGSSESFNENFARPIKFGMKSDATLEELADGSAAQRELQRRLRPLLLRRNKSLIAHQMPTKRDHVVWFRMAPMQEAVYRRVLALPDVQLLLSAKNLCPCGSGSSIKNCMSEECDKPWQLTAEKGGILYPMYHDCQCDNAFDAICNPSGCKRHNPEGCWQNNRTRRCPLCLIFPVMSLLRKVASHLELIKADPDDMRKDPERFDRECALAEAILGDDAMALGGVVQTKSHMRLADTETCGKLVVLRSLLSDWAKDTRGDGGRAHKVLVFSNSVRTLRIIEKMAVNAGYDYLYLDGSTPQADRQPMVKRFNSPSSSDFLFLASTGAGGVGLNLVGANRVVIFDPHWSPGADLQAMDRAFRIGQTRDVNVYRLIAADTIEQVQYLRQIYKQQHINNAVEGTTGQPRLFKGVKGEEHGELWGLQNLLANSLDSDGALEQVGLRRDTSGSPFNIQEIEPEVMAALEAEAAAAKERGELIYDDEIDNDDDGYGGIGGSQIDRLLSGDGGQGRGAGAGTGGRKKLKRGAAEKAGLAGILRHEAVLRHNDDEEATRHHAEIVVAKRREELEQAKQDALRARGRGRSGSTQPRARGTTVPRQVPTHVPPASMLECLAKWMEMSVEDAALYLFEMTPEERMDARINYAKDAAAGKLPDIDII